jgi:hypothetical protein
MRIICVGRAGESGRQLDDLYDSQRANTHRCERAMRKSAFFLLVARLILRATRTFQNQSSLYAHPKSKTTSQFTQTNHDYAHVQKPITKRIVDAPPAAG